MNNIKAKITEVVFNREWMNPGTNRPIFYFNMKVLSDDNVEYEGQFSTTKKDQNKFLIDEKYDITIEVKHNNNGEYNFFNKPKKDYTAPAASGKTWKSSPEKEAHIAVATASKKTQIAAEKLGLHSNEKVTGPAAMWPFTKACILWVDKKGGGNTQMKITAEVALDVAINWLGSNWYTPDKNGKTTRDQIFAKADEQFAEMIKEIKIILSK